MRRNSKPLIKVMPVSGDCLLPDGEIADRSVLQEEGSRYYLHHYRPDSPQSVSPPRRSSWSKRNSTFDPQLLSCHQSTLGLSPSPLPVVGRHTSLCIPNARDTLLLHRSSFSALDGLVVAGRSRKPLDLLDHSFVAATKSQLRQDCETCRSTVHRHCYVYCQHCPVVVHKRQSCLDALSRGCPSKELGIKGWGESRNPIQIRSPESLYISLEDVFLSGLLGLQANKCFDCGQPLNPLMGHDMAQSPSSKLNKSDRSPSPHGRLHLFSSGMFDLIGNGQSTINNDHPSFRVCHLTGKYYCQACHWNDVWPIPGSIFLLNDPTAQPVDFIFDHFIDV